VYLAWTRQGVETVGVVFSVVCVAVSVLCLTWSHCVCVTRLVVVVAVIPESPKKEAVAETTKPTFRVPHAPVSSFLSRNLPTSFLDLDDSAFADCHTSFRQFSIRIPEFNPENPFPLERTIADMLRTQLCLERVRPWWLRLLSRALRSRVACLSAAGDDAHGQFLGPCTETVRV
jgi:hypothetical protein